LQSRISSACPIAVQTAHRNGMTLRHFFAGTAFGTAVFTDFTRTSGRAALSEISQWEPVSAGIIICALLTRRCNSRVLVTT
jgi:hypothetical protein